MTAKHEALETIRGAQASIALAITALHSCNTITVVRDAGGKPLQSVRGMELLNSALHPNYWASLNRPFPHWLSHHTSVAIQTPENFRSTTGAVESWLEATMIAMCFEIVCEYASSTGHWENVKVLGWHRFARLIRNCVSHNFLLHLPKGVTCPVAWRDLTITEEMIGKPLARTSFLTQEHAFLLLDDMHSSIESDFA